MKTRRSSNKSPVVAGLKGTSSKGSKGSEKRRSKHPVRQSASLNKLSDTYKRTHSVGRRSSSNFVTYTQNGRLFYDLYTRSSPYAHARIIGEDAAHVFSSPSAEKVLTDKLPPKHNKNSKIKDERQNLTSKAKSNSSTQNARKMRTLGVTQISKRRAKASHPRKKKNKNISRRLNVERKLRRELGIDQLPTNFTREKRVASLNATAIMNAFTLDSSRSSNKTRTHSSERKDSVATLPCQDAACVGLTVQISDESDDAITEPMSLTPKLQVAVPNTTATTAVSELSSEAKVITRTRKKTQRKTESVSSCSMDNTVPNPTIESFHSHQVIPLGRDSFGVQQITHQVTFVNSPNANRPLPLPVLSTPMLPPSADSPNPLTAYMNPFNSPPVCNNAAVQLRPDVPVWNSAYCLPSFQITNVSAWQSANRPNMSPQFIPQTLTYQANGLISPTVSLLPTAMNQFLVPGSNGIQLAYPVLVQQPFPDTGIPQPSTFMPFRFVQPIFPSNPWVQTNPALPPPIPVPPDNPTIFPQASTLGLPLEQRALTTTLDSYGSTVCNSSVLPIYPPAAPNLSSGLINTPNSSTQNANTQQSYPVLSPSEMPNKSPNHHMMPADQSSFQAPTFSPLITDPIQCSSPIRQLKVVCTPKIVCNPPFDAKNETKCKHSPHKSEKSAKLGRCTANIALENDQCIKSINTADAWVWEGDSFEKPVFFHSNDPPVPCQCYPAIRHSRDGMIIREKDSVLLCSGPDRSRPPHVAKITALYLDRQTGSKMMALLWYYRPEHLSGTTHNCVKNELLASKHCDTNPVDCIEDRAYVLTVHAYARFMAKLKYMQTAHPRPPLSNIVPQSPSYCLHHTTAITGINESPMDCELCLEGAALSNVFFCRAVYDYKLKRITRSPFLGSVLSSSGSLLNTLVNRSRYNARPTGVEGVTAARDSEVQSISETRRDLCTLFPSTPQTGDMASSTTDSIVFPDPIFPSPQNSTSSVTRPNHISEQNHIFSATVPMNVDMDGIAHVTTNGTLETETKSKTDSLCPPIPSTSVSSTPIKSCDSPTFAETRQKTEGVANTVCISSCNDRSKMESQKLLVNKTIQLQTPTNGISNSSEMKPCNQLLRVTSRIHPEPTSAHQVTIPTSSTNSQSQIVPTALLFWPQTPHSGNYDRSVLETSADLSVNWAEHGEQIALSLDCRSKDPNCTDTPKHPEPNTLPNYPQVVTLPSLEPPPVHSAPNPSIHYAVLNSQHHGQDSHRLVML